MIAHKIIINASRVMPQIVASLTDDSCGVIYDRNLFIVQATVLKIFMTIKFTNW